MNVSALRKSYLRRLRYNYARSIGGTVEQAKRCQHSILQLQREFPGHEFPVELTERRAPGRKPRG